MVVWLASNQLVWLTDWLNGWLLVVWLDNSLVGCLIGC
jgi:hypothetical protein